MVWIQIRTDLGLNYLQRLSADQITKVAACKERVKVSDNILQTRLKKCVLNKIPSLIFSSKSRQLLEMFSSVSIVVGVLILSLLAVTFVVF